MADELVFTLAIKDNASPQIDAFTRKIKGLGQEAQKEFGAFRENFNKAFGDLGKPIQSVNDFKTAVLGLSGAFAAIGVQKAGEFVVESIKNFASYEDALASVQRTTGMTKTQVSELGEALRTLALTDLKGQLVADDLVTIAEAAGQMGISGKKDILEFTKAVAQVSTAADVEVSKSALAFGKIATMFRESLGDDAFQKIGNIGSAFDALADKSNASIEGILNYTNRLAGTATTIGLTVDQTAAIGATLEALGVPAERGSRAVSDVFLKLKKDSGSFASALEIDAEKLKVALETKPVEAVNMVIEAMARMNESNPTEFLNTMEDLLGKGSGVTEVVTKLAGGADMLKTNMSAAAIAMQEGTRAGESFATSADTQAGSWRAIMTAVDDLQKSLGQQLQPTLNTLGTWLQTAATWWADAFRADNINALFDSIVAGFTAMTDGFKQDIDGFKKAWNEGFGLKQSFTETSAALKAVWTELITWLKSQWESFTKGVTESIQTVKNVVAEIKGVMGGGGSVTTGMFEKDSAKILNEIQVASAGLLRTNSELKTQFFELRAAYDAAYANGGKPTEELVASTQRLKDAMAAAGGETTGLTVLLTQLDDAVMGVDNAYEGNSLTPALRNYIQAALAAGTTTQGLTQETLSTMQAVLDADASYKALEQSLNQNQRAILETEKAMQVLRQASISANDFEKKRMAEEMNAMQVKRSALMIEKKDIQEKMDLTREEMALGKDAIRQAQEQQKIITQATKEQQQAFHAMIAGLSADAQAWVFQNTSAEMSLQQLGMAVDEVTLAIFKQERADWQAADTRRRTIAGVEALVERQKTAVNITNEQQAAVTTATQAFEAQNSAVESLASQQASLSSTMSQATAEIAKQATALTSLAGVSFTRTRSGVDTSAPDYAQKLADYNALAQRKTQEDLANQGFGTSRSMEDYLRALGREDLLSFVFKHNGGWITPRRYHSGGLASDEVPAILQTGEYVLSRQDVRQIRGGDPAASLSKVGGGNQGGGGVHVTLNLDGKNIFNELIKDSRTLNAFVRQVTITQNAQQSSRIG